MFKILTLMVLLPCLIGLAHKNPNFYPNRYTIVQLFEWKWKDIGDECVNFLGPRGFGGVQISPPNEYVIIEGRPWYERYQPVSYILDSRSGNEADFKAMVQKCNSAKIRIYVDTVINHMAARDGKGTAGSVSNATHLYFPRVPYGPSDFHAACLIEDFGNKEQSRNCRLVGLVDLDQSKDYVRTTIVNYMNHLIALGVAGFRIDAAGHIWPNDLKAIYSQLNSLNVKYGFPQGSPPFIYQEVVSLDREYVSLGRLVEFHYAEELSRAFQGNNKLKWLKSFGPSWNLLDSNDALAFIDNHDTQRNDNSLTYKKAKQYKMANAFMLAHPYGVARIMSSFDFSDFDQAPPMDKAEQLISPSFNDDNSCKGGWVCEHRWREIYNMIEFRNIVNGTDITNWWDNDDQQIAFCRGNKGFIVFTNWGDISERLQTCLAPGDYCDVISGARENGKCTGKKVEVGDDGRALISLGALELNGMLAIHSNSKI